ncbi:GNAT family N-acetyltransferase [Minwuia sp.]|uniref:GNAT family N-acetyltransferase n=1 Tax=Minwuia sp. TaxID=2493630 RepID=UPI003A8DA8F1
MDAPGRANFNIVPDDPGTPAARALLAAHLAHSWVQTPETSNHTLDAEKLAQPGMTFWTVRDAGEIVGCGALKALDGDEAELKSMFTATAHRGRGVARAMLAHALSEARRRGFRRVRLETGTMDGYAAARALYLSHGFHECGPFGDYVSDPNSVFMMRVLD